MQSAWYSNIVRTQRCRQMLIACLATVMTIGCYCCIAAYLSAWNTETYTRTAGFDLHLKWSGSGWSQVIEIGESPDATLQFRGTVKEQLGNRYNTLFATLEWLPGIQEIIVRQVGPTGPLLVRHSTSQLNTHIQYPDCNARISQRVVDVDLRIWKEWAAKNCLVLSPFRDNLMQNAEISGCYNWHIILLDWLWTLAGLVPHLFATLVVVGMALMRCSPIRRGLKRWNRDMCPVCGYTITILRNTCPECGTTI